MLFLKSVIYLFLVPIIIGLGILQFSKKEKTNLILGFVIGYLFIFTIYELIAIPTIFMRMSFIALTDIWKVIMFGITVVSSGLVIFNFIDIIKDNIQKIIEAPKILLVIVLALIGLEAFMGFFYMHEDYDDSNFVAKATIAYDTNTLFVYDDKGVEYETLPSRQVLSPFPIFTASVAKILNVHPAIMAHTIFPPVLIILGYAIYSLMGKALFKDNKKMPYIFLIILGVIYMFGAYSAWSNFVFLLYRPWQGKALIANIFIPMIWLLFIKYLHQKDNFFWFILLLSLWGADLTSSMGLIIPTIAAGVLGFVYTISEKNISFLLKTCVCIIPSIIYGLMYLKIR